MSRMVRTAFAVLLLCVVTASFSHADEGVRKQKNLVGGELLGRGIFITVNYERYLNDQFSVGAGIFGVSTSDGAVAVLPLYAAVSLGYPHSLYLSAGATIFAGADFDAPGDDNTEAAATPVIVIGYQYQSESGFYVRPTINILTEFGIGWPGIAMGGSF